MSELLSEPILGTSYPIQKAQKQKSHKKHILGTDSAAQKTTIVHSLGQPPFEWLRTKKLRCSVFRSPGYLQAFERRSLQVFERQSLQVFNLIRIRSKFK